MSGCVALGLGDYGTIGFHFLTVDYGIINGTSLLTGAEAASGNYPLGYRETGPVNNVGAYSVGVTYARFINPQFSIGGTLKIVGQNLGENYFSNGVHKENKAYKFVFDGGVRFKTGFKSFCFGMAMRNFSSDVQRELIPEQLPMNFSLGGSIDLFDFILSEHSSGTGLVTSVDFVHYNNYSERVKIGIEHRMLDALSLRLGYITNNDVLSWSGGIGFRTDILGYELEANYSYSQAEIFSGISRISIGFAF